MPYPREVADIQEHGRVVDVAAGRRHTVVIVVHGGRTRTFAFGANELRQLGLDPSHPAFERPMILAPVEVKSVSRLKPIKVGYETRWVCMCQVQLHHRRSQKHSPLLFFSSSSCQLFTGGGGWRSLLCHV